MLKHLLSVAVLGLLLPSCTRAQFAGSFLQDDKYWGDGKAEFNIYQAREVRYGQPRDSEVIHILVRENFAPEAMVKADKWDRRGTYPVIKMNQILHIPTGVYVYQQMLSLFWRPEDGQLAKFSLTSSDSCGNTFKLGVRTGARSLRYSYDTYWEGMVRGSDNVEVPAAGIFYDELPLRVRTLDFSTDKGGLPIRVAPTLIGSKKGSLDFQPATLSYEKTGDRFLVRVVHAGGTDTFQVAAAAPHLLLEWKMADGGELKLKRALKLAYWEFNKTGDKERALNDPALRLY